MTILGTLSPDRPDEWAAHLAELLQQVATTGLPANPSLDAFLIDLGVDFPWSHEGFVAVAGALVANHPDVIDAFSKTTGYNLLADLQSSIKGE